ncbi:uncharacterized protein LOC102803355 isoform X2 [Saccoglossus kowalevskii]
MRPSFHFDNEDSSSSAMYILDKKMRDSISHKLIEKKRRDRINKYLNELCHLIPATANRKGKMEKAEILHHAVKHIRYLQSRTVPGQGLHKWENSERKQTEHRSNYKISILGNSSESEVPRVIYSDTVETGENEIGENKPLRNLNNKLSSMTIPESQISSNTLCNGGCKNENIDANLTTVFEKPENSAKTWKLPLKKRDWSRSQILKTKSIDKKNNLSDVTLKQDNVTQTTDTNVPLVNSGCFDGHGSLGNGISGKVESDVPSNSTLHRNVDTTSDSKHHSTGYSYISNIHPVLSQGVPVLALHPSGSHFVPLAIHPTHLASAIENSTEFSPVNDMALLHQPTIGFPCVPPNISSISHYPSVLQDPNLTHVHGASPFSPPLLSRQCQNAPTCTRLYSLSSSLPCLSSATSHSPLCRINSSNPCHDGTPILPCNIHTCREHIGSRVHLSQETRPIFHC